MVSFPGHHSEHHAYASPDPFGGRELSQGSVGQIAVKQHLGRSRYLFIGLACYLFSQWFTIPVIGVGPWALWPTVSDLSVMAMGGLWLLSYRYLRPMTAVQHRLFVMLVAIAVLSIASYCYYLGSISDSSLPGVNLGPYQVYRMLQLAVVFGIVSKIPLTPQRRRFLSRIMDLGLICGVITMLMTFFQVIPLGAITAHLPQGAAAGPWASYANIGQYGGAGWGTFAYNHAYVSIQLLMVMGLRTHLAPPDRVIGNSLFFCVTVVACFFSGSRNGLALSVLYSLTFFARYPRSLVWLLVGLFSLILASPFLPALELGGLENTDGSILERQATIFEAGDKDNLSGRDELWASKFEFLNHQPHRWFIGGGFGSGWDSSGSGESAHLLPLHITTEAGVVGVALWVVIFFQVLIALRQTESQPQAIFWITCIYLFSGITQETFYPVPALLGFMHFYAASVAIALQPQGYKQTIPRQAPRPISQKSLEQPRPRQEDCHG